MNYLDFVLNKTKVKHKHDFTGFQVDRNNLSEFQQALVAWALRVKRRAIFADTGLGKTRMELEFARLIPGKCLILAPLAVTNQTQVEGEKLGYDCTISRNGDDYGKKIVITNYERIGHFVDRMEEYSGIILDESSILKNSLGKTRKALTELASGVEFRLAASATPSPNDYKELGTHAEWLGVCTYKEMLSKFFIHDTAHGQSGWRLKKHGRHEFWKWLSTWGAFVSHPRDLGYEADSRYDLPSLIELDQVINVDFEPSPEIGLFDFGVSTLTEQRVNRKKTLPDRVKLCADIVNSRPDEQFLIWVEYNIESKLLAKELKGAVQITGSDKPEVKSQNMLRFASGDIRVLVTKPRIAGFGLNWQQCHNIIFFGVSHSYEQYYQCVRRCYRFGQEHDVNVYRIFCSNENTIVENLNRKILEHTEVKKSVRDNVAELTRKSVVGEHESVELAKFGRNIVADDYDMINGDCVSYLSDQVDDNSLDFSIFSPPFVSLYVFSDSPNDMSNVSDLKEFFEHFQYLTKQLIRCIKPGRLVAIHCMNGAKTITHHGHLGIYDFRGDMIRHYESNGFIYHSEVCIWKDPVVAAVRTKNIGLLNKQKNKDSSISRQGLADYIVVMRKPGKSDTPIKHDEKELPLALWQQYASPVWMDIRQTETLQYMSAKDKDDEKHISPLQIEVIKRCIHLWTNPSELVFSPFAGIGSEGYGALQLGRRFLGCELKKSYFDVAVRNLSVAKNQSQTDMFGGQDV